MSAAENREALLFACIKANNALVAGNPEAASRLVRGFVSAHNQQTPLTPPTTFKMAGAESTGSIVRQNESQSGNNLGC